LNGQVENLTQSNGVHPLKTSRRVLVTGADGQLAHHVARAFAGSESGSDTGSDVVALDRRGLDITDPAAVARVVADAGPGVIVNCAAFNDVDGAEDRPDQAMAVNAFAVRSLARAAEAAGAALVHYSTDFVFDGRRAGEPYTEADPPAPRSAYASSKLMGEWFALDAPRAYVLRVESLFGSPAEWAGRRGTLDAIVDGLAARREVRVFTDRVVSPSYTPDIAAATRYLLESGAEPGLYHCVNDGHGTWEQIAREAARLMGVEPILLLTTSDQVVLKAARPVYCALSPRKLAAAGFHMPAWQDALGRWLRSRWSATAGLE
jgi:dTDP-4-dehydrorhamnose reductase